MILGKVRIQQFKSIKDTGNVYLSKGDLVSILAGQNESGKTSFLRALRFFQEGAYSTFEEEDRRLEESPRVACTFYLRDEEYKSLKEETSKELADYFNKNGFTFVRGNIEEDSFDSLKYVNPDELKEIVLKYNESIITEDEGDDEKKDDGEIDSDEEVEEEFNPYSYFDAIRPEMVFYSSFIDHILPGKIQYADIANNQAVQDFQDVYSVDFTDLLQPTTSNQKRAREERRIRTEAEDSLNSYWHQKISGEEVEYSFSITLRPDTDVNKSYVDFLINQGDEPELSVSQKSHGFQWFVGFNLRLRAHEQSLEDSGLILLIDEPGQGLHEVAQQDVKDVIEELVKESNVQIIYTTHQPILLGKENINFSRLLLVDRTKEAGSKFKTISQLITSSGSKDALAPVKSALGLVSIQKLPTTDITIVTEGITEYFYLKTIFGNKLTIIPSAGVDQVPNIFSILFGWGINAKILVDDDTQGRKAFNKVKKEFFNSEVNADFKKTVLKITGCNGVEDLLSENVIKEILSSYGQEYKTSDTKIQNVEKVGKFIFAKSFFDKYQANLEELDNETKKSFKEIGSFLKDK